jgi:hypothetical protein
MVDGGLEGQRGEMPTPGIGRVAAGPGEARDKTKLDRSPPTPKTIGIVAVAALAASEGTSPGVAITRHLSANQIGQQRRQAIVLALQPVVLDRHVPAFDVAGFVETFRARPLARLLRPRGRFVILRLH